MDFDNIWFRLQNSLDPYFKTGFFLTLLFLICYNPLKIENLFIFLISSLFLFMAPFYIHCSQSYSILFFFFFFFFFFFLLFRATPVAYRSSQSRGRTWAVAASLHHKYSNAESEPRLPPIAQLGATLDPSPTEQGQGLNPCPHGHQSSLLPQSHNGNSSILFFKNMP